MEGSRFCQRLPAVPSPKVPRSVGSGCKLCHGQGSAKWLTNKTLAFPQAISSNDMHPNSAHASDNPVRTAVTSMPRGRARVFFASGGLHNQALRHGNRARAATTPTQRWRGVGSFPGNTESGGGGGGFLGSDAWLTDSAPSSNRNTNPAKRNSAFAHCRQSATKPLVVPFAWACCLAIHGLGHNTSQTHRLACQR
jgi:hypothetical protein